MSKMIFGVVGVLILVVVGNTRADSVSYSDSIPLQTTNWSHSVNVQQFDPSLGTLDSIQFSLTGSVGGLARFESRDNGPTTVTMSLAATVTLMKPDLSTLVVMLPLVQTTDSVTAYDGVLDFGGTSGRTYSNLSGQLTNTASINSPTPADLATFEGLGSVALPVTAVGASHGTGSGNLVQQFMTNAGAGVTVTYNYHVPEPTTLFLLATGGLLAIRRRVR